MRVSKDKRKYTAKTENFLGGFKIASPDETIDKIVKDKASIARFGDGELENTEIDYIYYTIFILHYGIIDVNNYSIF